jgi:hypothetical protein
MTADPKYWKKQIDAARRRRDQHITKWSQFALLHAKDHSHSKDLNDDDMVILPSGDQVRLGLIHSNVEQTLALLEVPEIGVRAQCMDFTRDLGYEDTHREAVVEQALVNSAKRSGLIKGTEEVDPVKRDGVVIGHGVCYTWYRVEEVEEETDRIPLYQDDGAGNLMPVLDEETQEHIHEPVIEKRQLWQAVQDEHVPVLEFLFDVKAKRIEKALWHGREQVIRLDVLKQDPRYTIPDDIEPTAYRVRDLYGMEESAEYGLDADSVKRVVIWDKVGKRLLTFLESVKTKSGDKGVETFTDLLLIADEPWPLTFSHPDASPFNAFVPIPANDHPFGVSQIEHIRNPAVEADKLRTRQANITRQIKAIDLVRKGVVDPDQLRRAYQSSDREVVEIDVPEDFDKNRDIIQLQTPGIPGDLYRQEAAAQDTVRQTSGISEVPFGGASTATESENMMSVGGARVNRKRGRYLAFLAQVLTRHKDFIAELGPEGQAVRTIGFDGQPTVLEFGREALAGEFDIVVMPGGETAAASPVEQKTLLEFGNMFLGRFGPDADRNLARELATRFGIRGVDKIIGAMRPMMPEAGGVDGRMRADMMRPDDYTQGQAIRAAVNARNE